MYVCLCVYVIVHCICLFDLPTETLLRLHLPLSDKVRTSSRGEFPIKEANYNPEASPEHSIGRCDGRCVLWVEKRDRGDGEVRCQKDAVI